ncbi:MAG: diguanylate cyclase [Candidatus Nanopelagicales bacterium]
MATASTWTTVAAAYAARGAVDDALVAAATAAGVGLVQVTEDGTVSWSDEAYRLHGRPRWRRVRTVDDVMQGMTPADAARVRSAYFVLTADPEIELRYAVRPDQGPQRELVLRALGRGVAIVHRAALRKARTEPDAEAPSDVARPGVVVDVRGRARTGDHHDLPAYATELDDDLTTTPVTRIDETTTPPADRPVEPGTAPADAVVAAPVPVPEDEDEDGTADDGPVRDIATAVLSASPDLVVLFDLAGRRIVKVAGSDADTAELLEQLTVDPANRQSVALGQRIVHPDDQRRMHEWRTGLAALAPDEVSTTELRFALAGGWRWRELRASSFVADDAGRVREVVILVRDVHDRIEAGLKLAERERAFREVFDASPIGLAVLDDAGRFEAVNDAFCRLVGRTRENVRSTVYEALLHHEDRSAAVLARSRRTSEGGVATATERRLLRSDGTVIWVRTRSSEIEYDHEPRTLLSVEDVTSAKAVEDRLRHDALHDALTGLPNRRLIVDRTERALGRARRSGTRLALFFIDLDDLKRVNDTHPWQHRAGDVLITSVAGAIRESLRDSDTLGRLGGDEFVAICEDAGDDATVRDLGERILAAVRAPVVIGAETVQVSASIGVAVPDADGHETADQLLDRADAAMYRAKTAGGSRVVRADLDAPHHASLDLAESLADEQLRMHYRPVVSLATGAVLGVEAVLRVEDPERGLLPEAEVRGALESGAGVLPVVHWALARAVDDVRTVSPSRAHQLSVWLSLPARAALAASTRRALEQALLGRDEDMSTAPTIVLGLHQRDVASLMRRHTLLRHLGDLTSVGPLGVGVVDFTADAVPLGTLRALDAVSVALDPALLDATREDRDVAELARSLVAGAEALGVISVAAGVESQEHLELARWLGVDAVSGDLVGPLAPLESWSQLLLRGVATLPAPPPPAPARPRPFAPRLPDPVAEPPAEPVERAVAEPLPRPVVAELLEQVRAQAAAEAALDLDDPPVDPEVEAPVAALAPVVVEPVAVEAVVVEPVAAESIAAESIAVEAVAVEPVAVEAVVVEPVAEAPIAVEPVVVEPVAVDPVVVEPVAEAPVAAPSLLLGDIGASLAAELGFDLHDPEPSAYEPAPEPVAPEPAPALPSAQPQTAPSSFAGFALPPSPFLFLRQDDAP